MPKNLYATDVDTGEKNSSEGHYRNDIRCFFVALVKLQSEME